MRRPLHGTKSTELGDKVAAYLVLAESIRREVEAYSALSFRQSQYDITVVRPDRTVGGVQAKATEGQSRSTDNAVHNLEREYDYLVLVVFDERLTYFILTVAELVAAYATNNPGTVCALQSDSGWYRVREELRSYESQSRTIIDQ